MSIRRLLVLSLASMGLGCASHRTDAVDRAATAQVGPKDSPVLAFVELSEVPMREVPELAVPESYDVRQYVRCGRLEGELRLCEISATSNRETDWAFLPAADVWVQTGTADVPDIPGYLDASTITTGDANHHVDEPYLRELTAHYKIVLNYHNHPNADEAIPMIVAKAEAVSRASNPDYTFPADKRRQLVSGFNVAGMTPSPGDMVSAIKDTRAIRQASPEARIEFRICSVLGVTEYGITSAGENRFENMTDEEIEAAAIAMYDDGFQDVVNKRVKGEVHEDTAIQYVVDMLTTEHTFVRFTRLADLAGSAAYSDRY